MKLRFGLKPMLLAIGLAAIGLAVITQVGVVEAEFEVWENNLRLTEDALIRGELRLGFEGSQYGGESWPFTCLINNVTDRELLKLQPGSKSKIRYRAWKLGPLKEQEPCRVYLTRVLRIDPVHIRGYVMIKGRTELVIDGSL